MRKWQSYDIWFLGYQLQQKYCFYHLRPIFARLPPLTAQKMKISKNKKNTWRYYLLHKCTKNYNILYCSGDMARDRCNFYFSFWSIFCLLTPVTAQKIKISRKWKKHLEISSFYTSVPKIMVICFTIPEIWHVTYVIVIFHFGLFFCAFTPLTSLKMKIKKKIKKKHQEILSFYNYVPQMMMICMVLEISSATYRIFCPFGSFFALLPH